LQLILELSFVILFYFWILEVINFDSTSDSKLGLSLTIFYIFLIVFILFVKIEIGYKYNELKSFDKQEFPDIFIIIYLVGIIGSFGIKLIPLLLLIPSWIFFHEWLLRPVMIYIIIFSIFLPFPYKLLRQFLEKDSEENYRVVPFPLKSQNISQIVYSVFRFFNFYIMFQIIFYSLSMSDDYFSIYFYIQLGLIIFTLIMQFSIIDLLNRLKSIFDSPKNI